MKEALITLYRRMSNLTLPECTSECKRPFSCCSGEYCAISIEWAKEKWDTTLEPTGHPSLPLMGDKGCIAPPHMRPLCTFHTCDISGLGFKRNDLDWTKAYFDLRDEISALELKEDQGNG